MTTSQNVTAPKQASKSKTNHDCLTTSQNVTAPKPRVTHVSPRGGLTTSQNVTAPKPPPPNFGQNGNIQIGGNPSSIETIASQIAYIRKSGDMLVVYGGGTLASGLLFYPSSGETWIPSRNVTGTQISGGWSGGGSATGSQAAREVVELFRTWENRFAYSQGAGRLFDYQSECHCSKTRIAIRSTRQTFDYQSECHCSKTNYEDLP